MQITATYTDTEENFTFFAMAKGWTSDSDITLIDFCQQQANKAFLEIMTNPIVNSINNQFEEQRLAQIATTQAQIASNLNVIVE